MCAFRFGSACVCRAYLSVVLLRAFGQRLRRLLRLPHIRRVDLILEVELEVVHRERRDRAPRSLTISGAGSRTICVVGFSTRRELLLLPVSTNENARTQSCAMRRSWRARTKRSVACVTSLVLIIILVAAALSPRAPSEARSRALAQFNDVGNISAFGVGGFDAWYRGWWLPLFPTSCFTVGTKNPLYLTQCVAFSTSF